jgi:hypothetical protein
MAQTPPRSLGSAHQQHALFARQSAMRVKACAEQILLDLAHGRPPVRANGRQVVSDALALCEALAAMMAYEEIAARLTAAA